VPKPGLGRGLGALIPETELEVSIAPPGAQMSPGDSLFSQTQQDGFRSVALGRIKPNPDQPRKTFTESSLSELADSIKRHGVIQPIVVEHDGSGGFTIIAGERRWRAAERIGLKEVPVVVRTFSPEKKLEISIVENVQREDLNPIEEAEAYRHLMDLTGASQDEVAEKVGKSRPAVANALRLLKLPPESLQAVKDGTISAGHARAVLACLNPADQAVLCHRVIADGLSVREAESLAGELNRGGRSSPPTPAKKSQIKIPPELAELEQRLIGHLGTKVTVKGDVRKGSITIEYFSMDDLERIFDLVTRGEA
jgi:ParB family chromosome partitioning protein